jgi:holo-[acyl-carrier protein] synthase
MDGNGRLLISVGHDIQQISEMEKVHALREPGVFFTQRERDNFKLQNLNQSLAAAFAAKEAFFKALPTVVNFFWTDVEVLRDQAGKPHYHLGGAVGSLFTKACWRAVLSVSHSGDYVSVVTLITTDGSV